MFVVVGIVVVSEGVSYGAVNLHIYSILITFYIIITTSDEEDEVVYSRQHGFESSIRD